MSEIQNGVNTDDPGVIPTYAGAMAIDHAPTDNDKTGGVVLMVQYNKSDVVVDNGHTCLYRATAKYIEM